VRCSQKFKNFPLLEVQGRSRSSMLIKVKSLSPVLVRPIISSMSVPICNCFHTRRTNSNNITFFRRYPSLTPSFEGNPLTQGHKILSQNTIVLVVAHSKVFVIPACTVLIPIECDRRTEKRTDGQTDGQTPGRWLRRAKHYMLSRVKIDQAAARYLPLYIINLISAISSR